MPYQTYGEWLTITPSEHISKSDVTEADIQLDVSYLEMSQSATHSCVLVHGDINGLMRISLSKKHFASKTARKEDRRACSVSQEGGQLKLHPTLPPTA